MMKNKSSLFSKKLVLLLLLF